MKKINIIPNYFNNFKCLTQNCPNTCCTTWQIKIDNETYKKYTLLKDDFIEYILENISTETKLISLKKHYCPFLNENKLCKIQLHYGHNYLCKTCREYPRENLKFKSINRKDLLISCPAVANIINKLKYYGEEVISEDKNLNNKKEYIYYKNLSKLFLNIKTNKLNTKQSLIFINKLINKTSKLSTLTNIHNNNIFQSFKKENTKKDINLTYLLFKSIYSFYKNINTKNKEINLLLTNFKNINFENKNINKIYNSFIKKIKQQVNINNFLYYINKIFILDIIKEDNLNYLVKSIFFILSIIFFGFIHFYFSSKTKDYKFTSLISNIFRVCFHSKSLYLKIFDFPNIVKESGYSLEQLLLSIKI